MSNKEYKPPKRGPMGPGPHGNVGEKAKDFKGSIK